MGHTKRNLILYVSVMPQNITFKISVHLNWCFKICKNRHAYWPSFCVGDYNPSDAFDVDRQLTLWELVAGAGWRSLRTTAVQCTRGDMSSSHRRSWIKLAAPNVGLLRIYSSAYYTMQAYTLHAHIHAHIMCTLLMSR